MRGLIKAILFGVLLVNCATINAQHASNFSIVGYFKNADKVWVHLSYLVRAGEAYTDDSAWVDKGNFTIRGYTEGATYGIIYSNEVTLQSDLFFEPGATSISADTGKNAKVVVGGGEACRLFNIYRMGLADITQHRDSALMQINGKLQVKDSSELSNLVADFYAGMNKQQAFTTSFARAHPESGVSAYILYANFCNKESIDLGLATLSRLSNEVQQSKYARLMISTNITRQLSKAGQPAALFSLPDTAGKMVKLIDFRGNYVLVDFWASWCEPCRNENPNTVAAYKKYHGKGFEILSVSLDSKKEAWLKAIYHDGLTWVHVSDLTGSENKAAKLYSALVLPANVLIDKKGNIIAENLFGDSLFTILESLLD